jgi:N-dimethylarginine dimethylaminohydrolase
MDSAANHDLSSLILVAVTQQRIPRKRTYLVCRPEYFEVKYAINAWMDTAVPVDNALAVKQWEVLRETLLGLGHDVHQLAARPGLPDMVFAANGGFTVDGTVYGARFKHAQRTAEAAEHQAFYEADGWTFVAPSETTEGEGDFAYLPEAYGGLVLAGYGFRTEPEAHMQAQDVLNRPVISLRLVDPRFYHLDMALAALDDRTITYFPGAFSTAAQRVLAQLFPDAVIADEVDALAFGLNLVSDGHNVVLNGEASGLAARLDAAGYHPVPVDLSELKKGGGSVKCCVAELRR